MAETRRKKHAPSGKTSAQNQNSIDSGAIWTNQNHFNQDPHRAFSVGPSGETQEEDCGH
jgi:hypothetical protein